MVYPPATAGYIRFMATTSSSNTTTATTTASTTDTGAAASAEMDFSPSIVHQRLMRELRPALAYEGGDVKTWQNKLRRKVRTLTGYDRMPRGKAKCELNVRTLWRREHELGTIEKLVFTSEPGCDVPAYLCLPRHVKPPYPVFICVQGHSTGMHNSVGVTREDDGVPMDAVPGDRDFGLGCMRRGIAALCIEQRSLGERRETRQAHRWDHPCVDATMHAMMLGRTLIAERVYDVERGIDLLAGRRDMDLRHLGLMGNSGGGTITAFGSALLRRVRYAIPSCFVCTWRDSLMNIKHCTDNYVPGILAYAEAADVVGLFAPRPLVVVAGEKDEIFPIAGVHEAFEQIRRIYAAAGAADHCRLVVGAEGHRFYAEQAWAEMMPMLQGT